MATEAVDSSLSKQQEAVGESGQPEVKSTTTVALTESIPVPLAGDATSEKLDKWMEYLDKDLKADKDAMAMLGGFKKGLPDLARAYVELKKSSGIHLPNEKATPEDLAAFRKAVGVPDKPEDYKLDEVKLPNGETLDPEWDKGLKALAHKINISQGQLNELSKWYFADLAQAMKFVKTTAQAAHAALRKEMGADYEAAMTFKARAVSKFLTPAAATRFEKTGLGNDPEIIKMFSAIGKAMGDHFFAEGSRGEKPEAGEFGRRTDAQLAETLYPPVKK